MMDCSKANAVLISELTRFWELRIPLLRHLSQSSPIYLLLIQGSINESIWAHKKVKRKHSNITNFSYDCHFHWLCHTFSLLLKYVQYYISDIYKHYAKCWIELTVMLFNMFGLYVLLDMLCRHCYRDIVWNFRCECAEYLINESMTLLLQFMWCLFSYEVSSIDIWCYCYWMMEYLVLLSLNTFADLFEINNTNQNNNDMIIMSKFMFRHSFNTTGKCNQMWPLSFKLLYLYISSFIVNKKLYLYT